MSDLDAARDAVEAALSQHLTGMTTGWAIVIERINDAGESTLTVLNTPMTPWHLTGLLQYGLDEAHVPLRYVEDEDFDT